MSERILVLHDTPSDFAELLSRRCPDAAIRYATQPAQVLPALREHAPSVVLSIKHSGFPGAAHRPAIDHACVRWLHIGGSGFEHFLPWDPARVTVTHSAGVLAPFLAETTLAALLSLAVGLPRYREQQRQRQWAPHRFPAVSGRTLLLVGVGSVGGEVAVRAQALGLRVIGVRPSGAPHPAVERMVTPDQLLRVLPEADFVSLHQRLDARTAGSFGAREFAAMRTGAYFLNSARGAIVQESALLHALRSAQLAGAWLDVFANEPLPAEHPLWAMEQVLITPHCADQVLDFPRRFAQRFCDLRDARDRGEPLPALRP